MTSIVIRDQADGAEVHRIDTTKLTDRERERAFMGVMRQADLDRYTVNQED